MIGGQICFSILVLDAMHRLGIHMSEEGAEAYYYAWRVVGAMLGCDTAAAPKNLTELARTPTPTSPATWGRPRTGCG